MTTAARGSILLVGTPGAELTRLAAALEPLAETRTAASHDGLGVLVRFPADVILAHDGDGNGGARFLTQAALVRPAALRILLTPTGTADLDGLEAVTLPVAVEKSLLEAVCAVALRCARAERAGRPRGFGDGDPGVEEMADRIVSYEGIFTRSRAMQRVLHLLHTIEGTDTTVLVQGETGTGKELVAQAIHNRSRRRGGRFVAVNLGAISDPLKESELFGHVRGAFTGATESRGGMFVEANGGTIFLDEVADASAALQVALLRVLEEGTITPVGADRPRPVDVRVISGTNRDLEALVHQGHFRRDLYYRLHVFPIELPPLRDRPEDIFPLANHFLNEAAVTLGKPAPGISREARAVLEAHSWEGNVRELRNVMERAAILCRGGLIIAADLPTTRPPYRTGGGGPGVTIAIPPGGVQLQHLEREIFAKTLALAEGNQSQAARMLGLRESTFRFRLDKLGLGPRRVALGTGSQPVAKPQRATGS